MIGSMFKRGFSAIKEEEARRAKVAELKKGRLFRFYVPKDKSGSHIKDIPVIFLTEEPINFWEHNLPQGGNKFVQVPCQGEGCPHCELDPNQGGKPRFVSAWLIVDRSEFEYKDQSGAVKSGKDRIKLLVRGMTDAAILENKSAKFGLTKYDWTVTKVGTGTSSSMQFERGDKLVLTPKQLEVIMGQLPENLRNLNPYDIIEMQLMGEIELASGVSVSSSSNDEDEADDSVDEKVREGLQTIDDEDDKEEEMPKAKGKGKLQRKAIK